jgi:hypothetical protein
MISFEFSTQQGDHDGSHMHPPQISVMLERHLKILGFEKGIAHMDLCICMTRAFQIPCLDA